ncbi:MAG: anthranilate phosphoribosyltransferase, partial [Deferribacterota bacterium]|nr:anthranilate phosphoribosyltransferase [Deferribacterota bacterium]
IINPSDFFKPFPIPVVNSKKESISLFLEALKGENEKLTNLISINSALAIHLVSGASLEYAFYYAKRALQRKKVWRKFLSLRDDSYI